MPAAWSHIVELDFKFWLTYEQQQSLGKDWTFFAPEITKLSSQGFSRDDPACMTTWDDRSGPANFPPTFPPTYHSLPSSNVFHTFSQQYHHELKVWYRVFIKYCVFFLKMLWFFLTLPVLLQALGFDLPLCTHTDTKGKPREARIRNIF